MERVLGDKSQDPQSLGVQMTNISHSASAADAPSRTTVGVKARSEIQSPVQAQGPEAHENRNGLNSNVEL